MRQGGKTGGGRDITCDGTVVRVMGRESYGIDAVEEGRRQKVSVSVSVIV